jgi:acyl carrier protein
VNADEIRARLAKVFQQVLGRQVALRDDMKPGDVEDWDSVMHVTIVLATEREFKIKFKGADIANIVSVGDLVKHIQARV